MGNLNEGPDLLFTNVDIYLDALFRMQELVNINDEFFKLDFTAEEIRISKNLYDYNIAKWKSFRERLQSGKYEIYKNKYDIYSIRHKDNKNKN